MDDRELDSRLKNIQGCLNILLFKEGVVFNKEKGEFEDIEDDGEEEEEEEGEEGRGNNDDGKDSKGKVKRKPFEE